MMSELQLLNSQSKMEGEHFRNNPDCCMYASHRWKQMNSHLLNIRQGTELTFAMNTYLKFNGEKKKHDILVPGTTFEKFQFENIEQTRICIAAINDEH